MSNDELSPYSLIEAIKSSPAKVLWSKQYWAEQDAIFDVFYSFCYIEGKFISLHGEMPLETFHKRRETDSKIAKLYKCTYTETDQGLVQKDKEYIGLGADPRMVSDGKNAYAYVTGYGEAKHPAFLYVEKDNSLHQITAEEDFNWGKNWQPFLKDDRLFIVHELTPFSIYEINLNSYELTQSRFIDSNFDLNAHYTNHTMFRGGANAVSNGDYLIGIGRASAQPYKHTPFIWSNYKEQFPSFQFLDFFNQMSSKGFNIIDPTCFFKIGNTLYLGLACSETCWFHRQNFINLLLAFKLDDRSSKLPSLNNVLKSYKNTETNRTPNLSNHLFHCDRMQHEIPYSFEYGVQSTGQAGTLVYGPYVNITESSYLKVELSYLTMDQHDGIAGKFDIHLSKTKDNGEACAITLTECQLKTTNRVINQAILFFDTSSYIGYNVEFRVFANEDAELNAFHIRTCEIKSPIVCASLPATFSVENLNGIRSCDKQEGFLFFGPYHTIAIEGEQSATLYYKADADLSETVGIFDISLISPENEQRVLMSECLKGSRNKWGSHTLSFSLDKLLGYQIETRLQVNGKTTVSASHISISTNSPNLMPIPQRGVIPPTVNTSVGKTFHELWNRFKHSYQRTATASFKNRFIRKSLKLITGYPSLYTYHFYYERANSFMAPKLYEFTKMFKKVKLNKNDILLDLGCGEGSLTFILGKSVHKVIGVDPHQQCIKDAKLKAAELAPKISAEFHCAKLEELALEKQSIDKIVSFSVIEHIPNYMEVFEEIFRILKKDGELIISVDSFQNFDKEQRETHRQNFEVQKYFNQQELHKLLKDLGFREVSVEPIFNSHFSEKWFTRVMNSPSEYFGTFKRLYSFILYFLFLYHEKRNKSHGCGIFLVARCTK